MRNRTLLSIATSLVLGAGGLLWAQAPAQPAPAPRHGPMMHGAAPGEGGGPMRSWDEMRAQREAMQEQRRAMMEQMQATDAKLDALLARMDDAQGSAKVDAMAEVVRELVAERKTIRSMMESMPMVRTGPLGAEAGTLRPMREPAPVAPKNDSGSQ